MIFRDAKPVTVQRLVDTQDELGGLNEDWQTVGTIQAEIWPLQGKVTRGEMGVTEKSTHRAFSSDPGAFESNTRLVDAEGNIFLVGWVPPGGWKSHGEAVLEFVGGG